MRYFLYSVCRITEDRPWFSRDALLQAGCLLRSRSYMLCIRLNYTALGLHLRGRRLVWCKVPDSAGTTQGRTLKSLHFESPKPYAQFSKCQSQKLYLSAGLETSFCKQLLLITSSETGTYTVSDRTLWEPICLGASFC